MNRRGALKAKADEIGTDVPTLVMDTWEAMGRDVPATANQMEVSENTIYYHLRKRLGNRQHGALMLTDAEVAYFDRAARAETSLVEIARVLEKPYHKLRRWANRNGWRAKMIQSGSTRRWIWIKRSKK
jgi:hypothetical protein